MLDMRLWCECCAKPLQPNTPEAAICSFECTFCLDCALKLEHICPNCSGVLVQRPTRSLELLKKFPANPMNVKQAKRCP